MPPKSRDVTWLGSPPHSGFDSRRVQSYLLISHCDHIAAARLHRLCAQKVAGASTIDCQIAIAAIRHGCALLSADMDFERMALHCELVLA